MKHTVIGIALLSVLLMYLFFNHPQMVLKSVPKPQSVPKPHGTDSISRILPTEINSEAQADGKIAIGQDSEAEKLLNEALKLDPNDSDIQIKLAALYERKGRIKATVSAYQHLIEDEAPSSIAADITTTMHYTLALLHDDQSSKAAEIFNQAMVQSAYAEIPDAVRDRASETGDNRELNSYVQKYAILAERADPGNPDVVGLEAAAHLILGMIPPQHGMVSLNYRIDQTKAAMRLRPNWGKVYFTYAQLLRQARRYREAQVAEARALQLGDLDAIAKRDRERAIAQQHKADMARWRVVRIPRTTPDPQMQAFIDNAHKWVQTHKK